MWIIQADIGHNCFGEFILNIWVNDNGVVSHKSKVLSDMFMKSIFGQCFDDVFMHIKEEFKQEFIRLYEMK